jgi:spore maturation protein CgeB
VWSPKKEQILSAVIDALPNIDLRIWGPFWNRAKESVQRCWQKRSAYGDELAAICSCSTINLGLLSEAGQGTLEGDRTTARTWQIPACGGFLLHEDTQELRAAFVVGEEAAAFCSIADLVSRISQYLKDSEGRERIRLAGQQRCVKSQYSYRSAADRVLTFHRDRHPSP